MEPASPFAALLEQQIPRLRRYALALTRDPSRADDLVQDTLVRALAKQQLWQPGTNLQAWLFTLMHHQHVNDTRKHYKRGEVAADDTAGHALAYANAPATGNPLAMIEVRQMAAMLATLPRGQQRVLIAAAVSGDDYVKMAAWEGVPVGTVRSRLSRGRDTLRLLMAGTTLSAAEREKLDA